jgi:hypothetical protein
MADGDPVVMRPHRRIGVRLALLMLGAAILAAMATPAASARAADASALYNAGTAALDRGDLGKAVAFLRAAERLDPRAPDVRRNLGEARARAAVARGAEPPAAPSALRLSARESWWLAALLLCLGAVLAAAGRGPARARFVTGHALLAAGLLLLGWRTFRAHEESVHPEAVVVAPSLPAGPAPDERPRAPFLLSAGEEVRLGRTRGALVEIRVAGTTIGWAPRSGVWRVADAPRYTVDPPRP